VAFKLRWEATEPGRHHPGPIGSLLILGRRLCREVRGPLFFSRQCCRILVSLACRVKYLSFELMILQLVLASGNAL
jgi:hypothetical protein